VVVRQVKIGTVLVALHAHLVKIGTLPTEFVDAQQDQTGMETAALLAQEAEHGVHL
jgi:hypothetical protein